MFEASLVESQHLIRTNSRWTTLLSLSLQLALAATLAMLPLLHPEALRFSAPPISLVAPPPQAPAPPQTMRASAPASDPRVFSLPSTTHLIPHPSLPPIDPNPNGFSISGALSTTGSGDFLSAVGNSTPRVVAHPTPPLAEATPKTIHVSSGVAEGLLLAPLHPIYPPIAIATHTEGTVTIHAIISRTGTVESAQILSGPSLLRAAALDAVRDARYNPYRLNGQPVEVETTFSIHFKLGD